MTTIDETAKAMCPAAASPITAKGKKNESASQRQPTRHCSDRLSQQFSPSCPPEYLTTAIAAILGPKLPAMNSIIPTVGNPGLTTEASSQKAHDQANAKAKNANRRE
ncbi:hypothetical protein VB780_25070 [Leptolyngbya sp. CCNP1308]|uniref:hypothetical protein n=1 Tax=Leptolyngbya sp. CCNP1308 TaxID=3110255 RepID=UPI002B2154CB|nr:hypothetical protein [Leptolyngbya sp. CCNP1308]MEA5451872.1 hypothetical protein [Leptolyngbya sp. CCNP1308]